MPPSLETIEVAIMVKITIAEEAAKISNIPLGYMPDSRKC
jgi:hypothetical protein